MSQRKVGMAILAASLLALVGLGACTAGRPGDLAPDFTIPLYAPSDVASGDQLTLSDLRGKPVVVNFWAPLCPPCRAEMPHFERTWQRFKEQGVVVVGVDVGPFTGLGNKQQAAELLEEINITYPVGQAQTGDIVLDYQVTSMPTTLFVRADGTIARRWDGALDQQRLVALTEELLQ